MREWLLSGERTKSSSLSVGNQSSSVAEKEEESVLGEDTAQQYLKAYTEALLSDAFKKFSSMSIAHAEALNGCFEQIDSQVAELETGFKQLTEHAESLAARRPVNTFCQASIDLSQCYVKRETSSYSRPGSESSPGRVPSLSPGGSSAKSSGISSFGGTPLPKDYDVLDDLPPLPILDPTVGLKTYSKPSLALTIDGDLIKLEIDLESEESLTHPIDHFEIFFHKKMDELSAKNGWLKFGNVPYVKPPVQVVCKHSLDKTICFFRVRFVDSEHRISEFSEACVADFRVPASVLEAGRE